MTVAELFEKEDVDVPLMEQLFDGPYWENCADFVTKNWNREIETMSQKQASWLTKILDDCVEARIERKK